MNELTLQLTEAERHKLVEQYQPYVHKLALQIFQKLGGNFELEELVSYGNLGLIEAAERFNPQRQVSFITFCHYRVKGAIFDGLRQMGLRPQHVQSPRVTNWEYAANNLLQVAADDEATTEVSSSNVVDEVGNVESLIDNLIPIYLLSLESEEAKNALDNGRASAQEEIEQNELIKLLHQILSELPTAEKDLLEAIYFKHIPMTQIAINEGVNKSWISRRHSRAIQHLREKLSDIGFLAKTDVNSKSQNYA